MMVRYILSQQRSQASVGGNGAHPADDATPPISSAFFTSVRPPHEAKHPPSDAGAGAPGETSSSFAAPCIVDWATL